MTLSFRLAAVFVVLAVYVHRAAAEQAIPVTPTPPADKVALVFDDQKLSDSDRAKLFSIIAESVPFSQWRTVTVIHPMELRAIVDKYYDFFEGGEFGAPLTAQAAIDVLQQKNGIETGSVAANTTLKIPPFPVRAYGRFDYPRKFRIFNANTHGYAVKQNANVVRLPTRSLVADVKSDQIKPQRDASATAIVLNMTAETTARLVADALPPTVVALSAIPAPDTSVDRPSIVIGMVSMELLEAEDQECPPAREILERSAFRARQKARVQHVLDTKRDRLLDLAGQRPLVILDVGFISHHGSRVQKVAEQTLEQLGAPPDLARKIKPVDLYPVNEEAQKVLEGALEEYVKSQQAPAEAVNGEFVDRLEGARKWIRDSAKTVKITGPRLDIPEVLVQAMFWKYVSSSSLLNMSFRMQAPVTAALLNQFAQGSVTFAVAAVGNRVEAISPGWVPQDAIMARPNFVNVTYGTEDGEVRAQYTQQDTGARVPLLAPGCGFEGINEKGSSLASPYVAAASWLRTLLDQIESDVAFAPERFWRELVSATRPIPTLQHSVESGGMFDAAMLVAPPDSSHFLLKRDGSIVPLTDLRIDYLCKVPGGAGFSMPPIIGLPPSLQTETRSVAVYVTNGKTFLWQRTIPLDSFGRAISRTGCELEDFGFTGNAGTIDYPFGKMNDFRADIAVVTW